MPPTPADLPEPPLEERADAFIFEWLEGTRVGDGNRGQIRAALIGLLAEAQREERERVAAWIALEPVRPVDDYAAAIRALRDTPSASDR